MRSDISTIRVVILIVIVIVAGVTSVYLLGFRGAGGGNAPSSVSTVTETSTLPCPSSLGNQTTSRNSTTDSSLLNFGSLFGNFSAMTVVLYGNGSTGNWVTTSSFSVLNSSSYTSSTRTGTIYEVNVTTVAIEPNVGSAGNHTDRASVVANFSTGGSENSRGGEGSSASYGDIASLLFFSPIVTQNFTSGGLSIINKTTISIGTVRMPVTNYEHPALMSIGVQEGCGYPATTTQVTIYNWTVQEGVAPGTDFLLLTKYHQIYSVPTSPGSPGLGLNWKVTSLTVS